MENKTITLTPSLNNVILTGCVGDEKNIHKNEAGNYAGFRFAHNIGENKVVWVDVKAFNNEKKPLDLSIITKGQFLKIEGHLSVENFERKDGTPGSKVVIVADKMSINAPVTFVAVENAEGDMPEA